MSDIEMQPTEGANTEPSPSAPSTPASGESGGAERHAEAAPSNNNNSTSENVPFHEHPRWKEVMSERDQFKQAMQEMQRRITDYESKFKEQTQPKELTPEQKMLERLKGIDPEYAKFNESILSKLSKVEQMEQMLATQRAEADRSAVQSTLSQLHEQHKVPTEHRELYRALLKEKAAEMGAQSVKDLPAVYKAVHDNVSKIIDTVKRSERESYVASKKQDSNVPSSQPRGNAAKPAQAPKDFPKDPDAARQEVVKRAMANLRSSRNAG